MHCVVTGAAGFIGSSLCDALLASGHSVLGIDSFSDYYPRQIKEANLTVARECGNFRLTESDLLGDQLVGLLEDAEVVFHHAGQPGVRSSWGTNFSVYTTNNILATQRVLEACRVTGVRRLVFASSSSVYGNSRILPVTEDMPCSPVSPYGLSKLAAEHLCRTYHEIFGVPSVVLRYFTVYGPRQRPDMAFHKFIRAALTGEPIEIYGDGNQTRDFTYVSDAVAATVASISNGPAGQTYNIGGGIRLSMNGILRQLEAITSSTIRVAYSPAQPGDVRDSFADTTRAKGDLLFAPSISLGRGLRNEVQWLEELMRKENTIAALN